jgi:hypothetical protein
VRAIAVLESDCQDGPAADDTYGDDAITPIRAWSLRERTIASGGSGEARYTWAFSQTLF